jgi:DNA-binding XRE family transcriptional regulator
MQQDPSTIFLHYTASRLAEEVRQVRLGLNMTQATVALRIGVSLPTYKKFEKTGEISLLKFLEVLRVIGRLQDVTFLNLPAPKTPSEAAQQAQHRQRARPRKTSSTARP